MEPLTAEHEQQINDSLEGLRKGEEILKRAKSAGMDVDTQIADLDASRTKLLGLKRAFFPTGA